MIFRILVLNVTICSRLQRKFAVRTTSSQIAEKVRSENNFVLDCIESSQWEQLHPRLQRKFAVRTTYPRLQRKFAVRTTSSQIAEKVRSENNFVLDCIESSQWEQLHPRLQRKFAVRTTSSQIGEKVRNENNFVSDCRESSQWEQLN